MKQYLWGGRNLEKLGRDLPEGLRVAESWEISSHTDGLTVVSNGPLSGKTLPQLVEIMGVDLVGSHNLWALEREIFPLMVKLLDAANRLSVQVHPDDDYALKHEGNELGKAEMWVVLDAKPGAAIIYGFSRKTSPEEFRSAILSGNLEPYLNHIPVQVGDHVCVPPGTLHAILEGVLIAEIQQNSNTTYRVYDWNRIDADGQPRALHVERAMDVINFNQVKFNLPGAMVIEETQHLKRERLCQNPYFIAERIVVKNQMAYSGQCDGTSLEIWGVLSGEALIAGIPMRKVQFCLLPAA
ncbi:MAG: class I mannose-6-phosphate isomerase, partial [Brevefilum sp.]|nr:class I mannose-6-phosphate isomerase [Brevefilum sp.]